MEALGGLSIIFIVFLIFLAVLWFILPFAVFDIDVKLGKAQKELDGITKKLDTTINGFGHIIKRLDKIIDLLDKKNQSLL